MAEVGSEDKATRRQKRRLVDAILGLTLGFGVLAVVAPYPPQRSELEFISGTLVSKESYSSQRDGKKIVMRIRSQESGVIFVRQYALPVLVDALERLPRDDQLSFGLTRNLFNEHWLWEIDQKGVPIIGVETVSEQYKQNRQLWRWLAWAGVIIGTVEGLLWLRGSISR